MAVTIRDVSAALNAVFTTDAEDAARASGLVKRQRIFSGAAFVQTLTFGWLDEPKATLGELCQFASTNRLGRMTKQGLDNWFCPAAVATLQETLQQALLRAIGTPTKRTPLLNRFQGVHLIDGTTASLHPSLAPLLPGCGGKTPETGAAAIKLVVTLEITSGRLDWVSALSGRQHDQAAGATLAPFEPGSLLLFDLGFFHLDMLQQQDKQGVKWLCRVQSQTIVRLERDGEKEKLSRFLARQKCNRIDRPIWLGSSHRLPCRLLAKRVPAEVAAQRRERLLKESESKGQAVSEGSLAMCEWTVLITNASRAQLTLDEAVVLYRVRWQIELLFKVWKSSGELDESRGERAERILCEFYAKLLGLVVQHWAVLVAGDPMEISELKGARRVRKCAASLLLALLEETVAKALAALSAVLAEIAAILREWCRVEERKTRPNTRQRLQEAEEISRLQADLSLA